MTDDFDNSKFSKKMSLHDLNYPTTIKIHQLLAMDLENQNINDVTIHTLGRGSYGNHVISDMVRKKVKELKEKYPEEKIYTIVQFSALFRAGVNIYVPNVDSKDYPYDYVTDDTAIQNHYDFERLYDKHIDNIIELKSFCDENNVDSFFYFGWANIFENDVVVYDLTKKMKKLETFMYFFEYKDVYDEIGFYCAGNKPRKLNNFSYMDGKEMYLVNGDKYGGLIEYARETSDIGKRYHLIFDPHPNTMSYYLFYTEVIKNWLCNKNLVSPLLMDEEYENLLKKCFSFEYIRFFNTINATNKEVEKISDLSIKLIRENKIEDISYITRKFKELNKTFK
jgi:hypothetical protein